MAIHQERERDLARRLSYRVGLRDRRQRPTWLRRRIGHGLIRLGRAVASDAPLQLSVRQ